MKKNAALQFTITDFDPKIDIIASQETETAVKLAGLASFSELPTTKKPCTRTAIAVQRNITAV